GNGINFYDELENIEEQLRDHHMEFFDFEDVMKYLVGNGYHFYGDYVVKGKGSYAPVCYDAILKFFPFDIKLDSDADNDDIRKLRGIIERRYSGLVLPEGNRALCARLASIMVLSDRGRYCPAEKIIYSAALMEEIFEFIQSSPQSTFYYAELFSTYQGRLFAETNITNANFLHGVLKYLYPNDFRFERDLFVKLGAERKDVNVRLCDLLLQSRSPMSKSDILAAMPGLNDFVLAFAVARLPELIQWNYGFFNHVDNLLITTADREMLLSIINEEIKSYSGYLSEDMLYRHVKEDYPEFLTKNTMTSSQNLYYVCAYLFGELYRFRRPHILSSDFPVAELTIENVAKVLLGNRRTLNYTKFVNLAAELGWANGTFYSVFSNLEKEYIRISEDDYISKDSFAPSERFLDDTATQIGKYVDEGSYFAISSIFSFDSFPDCNMPWNSFLLQSLIEEYNMGYRIIAPQVKDRRFQRGIIVPADMPVLLYEDLVLLCMQKDGVTSLSELEMEKYLRNHGLITKVIPQELYDCERLPFKNDTFT
ncbi:MAG: hypothetical protein Q4B70_19495, partial [Lachnospiraceae bacterium]|nr:hypothetical protein [Lachnospiraceae bacterium]